MELKLTSYERRELYAVLRRLSDAAPNGLYTLDQIAKRLVPKGMIDRA